MITVSCPKCKGVLHVPEKQDPGDCFARIRCSCGEHTTYSYDAAIVIVCGNTWLRVIMVMAVACVAARIIICS